jgi:Domain of unknown function (DUF4832)/Domain of unknown function (DUF4874)
MYLPKLLLIGGLTLMLSTCCLSQLVDDRKPLTIAKGISAKTKKQLNVTQTYTPSDQNFPNPERGFAVVYDPPWPADLKIDWGFCNPDPEKAKKYTYTAWTEPLELKKLRSERDKGTSVAMVRYHLAEFRNKPLSPAYLKRLEEDFVNARAAGVKLVLHFTYNWPMGGPDAPIDKVLLHLDQLKPTIQKNVDVIAFMDAGFIGCWGEWHTSTNNLIGTDSEIQAVMNENSRLIIDKIFEILPKERMVAVRYPRYKFDYFNSKNGKPIAPLTAAEAFNGSKKARWGQEDDCLVCGEWNLGTYWSSQNKPGEIPNFLNQDNLYVVQTGEPGDIPPKPSEKDLDGDGYRDNYNSCPRVLDLFKKMRWSTINGNYNLSSPTAANKRWQQDGCYDTIAKKLGYRFRLIESSIPSHINYGGKLSMSFKITNDGWAAPYNKRNLEIILRNQKNGAVVRLNLRDDPRFWQPGKVYSVKIKSPLPNNLAIGRYDVLLNLPDPSLKLKNRPEYSIRLANENLWDPTSGYNSFQTSVIVKAK